MRRALRNLTVVLLLLSVLQSSAFASNEVLTAKWNEGYADGYAYAYQNGYGYIKGLEDGTDDAYADGEADGEKDGLSAARVEAERQLQRRRNTIILLSALIGAEAAVVAVGIGFGIYKIRQGTQSVDVRITGRG